jgi:hypothetical protein
MTANANCAIWARVSTLDQAVGNQLPELRQLAASRGMDVAAEITGEASAAALARARARARAPRSTPSAPGCWRPRQTSSGSLA